MKKDLIILLFFLNVMLFENNIIFAEQKEAKDNQVEFCYCSDLCGPREVKEDDTPFRDLETGICFCKQRDKDNYLINGCNVKDKENKTSFVSYCDTHEKKPRKKRLGRTKSEAMVKNY